MDASRRCPKVPATDTSTVLKMYREKGTHEMFIRVNRSRKFLSVGLVTMKRGGYIHSSSSGLSDCMMTYSMGRNMNTPKMTSRTVMPASPPAERARTTL